MRCTTLGLQNAAATAHASVEPKRFRNSLLPPCSAARRRCETCSTWAAGRPRLLPRIRASATALPPAQQPAPRQPTPEEEAELRHLCVEVAAAATLPPAEEEALLEAELGAPPLDVLAAVDEATLPQPMVILRCRPEGEPADVPETTFYILGTAHVSAESCADVAKLIRAVRPQFVFLELCKERNAMLAPGAVPREPTVAEAAAAVRAGRATPFSVVYAWLLARVGRQVDAPAGEEFRVALQEARAVGARYVLGDRPISITMSRMWAALSGWEKARLLGSMLWMGASKKDSGEMKHEIERLKETDAMSAAVAEFAKDYPSVIKPLVTERDQYMVYVMRKLASFGYKVVAVVGAGHLKGIREHWNDEIHLQELLRPAGK